MKAILRSAVLVAGMASSIALSTTGASAAGAGAFAGTADINCFGCGTSTGTASLTVAGVVGTTPAAGAANAAYTVNEAPGATCVVQGTASGNVTGAVNVAFNWTRVGAVAVISTTGDIAGSGAAVFVVTTAGVPCGRPISAAVAGALVGA